MRERKKKLIAQINVVPFIDVVLVLLIVFMAVSPIVLNSGIKVDLPEIRTKSISKPAVSLQWIVTLNKRGRVFLTNSSRNVKLSKTPISVKKLYKLIKRQQRRKNIEIYIRADRSISYGKVINLMATLQRAGVANVGLITKNIKR